MGAEPPGRGELSGYRQGCQCTPRASVRCCSEWKGRSLGRKGGGEGEEGGRKELGEGGRREGEGETSVGETHVEGESPAQARAGLGFEPAAQARALDALPTEPGRAGVL